MDDSAKKLTCCLIGLMLIPICALLAGCRQPGNRYGQGSPLGWPGSNNRYAANPTAQVPELEISDPQYQSFANNMTNEVQGLNQRLGASDADNQLLNTELASLQQKLQLSNQYNQSLKEQLAGTSSQIQQAFLERDNATRQVASLQQQLSQANDALRLAQTQGAQTNQLVGANGAAPTQLAGATLRANNSLLQKLSAVQIAGGVTRMDGDSIRIELPSDRLFVPGTYQIQPAQMPLLQNIVGTIKESFPRQRVGIEAHWDKTPLNPGTTDHQLTATQSIAVFDQLVQLGLPKEQLFTMAMASNRPRHQPGLVGGISPNRRIELIIYPETFAALQ